ncbi:MAG TPA: hypothetical protein VGJ66_16415, partial [Pyrinomonadaceae bacterium]
MAAYSVERPEALRYKWTVHGGEREEGQGTPLVTITNFDLRKESVTVSTFLELVRSGKLIHDVMESHD